MPNLKEEVGIWLMMRSFGVNNRLCPQYMCIGYSIYDKEKRKQTAGTDSVELPYCEGLEVGGTL